MKNYFKIYVRLSYEDEIIYVSDGYISVENNEFIEGYATTDSLVGAYDKEEQSMLLVFTIYDYIENLMYTLEFAKIMDSLQIGLHDIMMFSEMENRLSITIMEKITDLKIISQIENYIEYIKGLS